MEMPADAGTGPVVMDVAFTARMEEELDKTGPLDAKAPLLHDESIEFLDPAPNWEAWFRASGMEGDWTHGPRFTNADHSIDVALEGGGIALGRIVLVERYLEKGRLVAPFPMAMRAGAQYRFICPPGNQTSGRVATFLDWIREGISCIGQHAEGMTFVDP